MTGVLEVAVPTAAQINRLSYARLAAMTRADVEALPADARQARIDRLNADPTVWEVPDILTAFGIVRATWDDWRKASRTGRRRSGGRLRKHEFLPAPLPPDPNAPPRPGRPKLRYRASDLRRWGRGVGALDEDLFPQRRLPPGPDPRST
jgi:hypothetical protein